MRIPLILFMVLASSASEGPTLGSVPVSLIREATLSRDAHLVAGARSVAGTHRVVVRPNAVIPVTPTTSALKTRPPCHDILRN